MINQNDTRLGLRNILLDSGLIDDCDIAFEGHEFDPKGKSLWLRESILNVDQTNITKCMSNFEGIYVLGIFVDKNEDIENVDIFANYLNEIYNPKKDFINFNNIDIFVHYIELSQVITDDKWQFKNFNVYFRSTDSDS